VSPRRAPPSGPRPSRKARTQPDPNARLSRKALAREAETTLERIDRLVEIGAIVPVDGTFGPGDVVRARLIAAFEAAGIDLDHIATGIRERAMTLQYVELFYPHPGPATGRTYAEFAGDLGHHGSLLGPAITAMGLPAPQPTDPTRAGDERVLRAFLDAWSVSDPEITLRAARTFGDAVRRAAEAWVALFDEAVSRPLEGHFATVDELADRVVGPATRINAAGHELIVWLLDRHLDRAMTELNVDALERELERRGLVANGPAHPPAVAFVDIADYTRMTEELGDDHAARLAVRLAEVADVAARAHAGRVVKLLGDGVLLSFERPRDAIAAALVVGTSMADEGLPATHAGIDAGPIISRDGDVYGATVNTAARVAARAAAGDVLVTKRVVQECAGGPYRFDPIGAATFKGVAGVVSLFRATRSER
jgi:adenylate cyclase